MILPTVNNGELCTNSTIKSMVKCKTFGRYEFLITFENGIIGEVTEETFEKMKVRFQPFPPSSADSLPAPSPAHLPRQVRCGKCGCPWTPLHDCPVDGHLLSGS